MGWPGFHSLSSEELLYEVFLSNGSGPVLSCPAAAGGLGVQGPCAPVPHLAACATAPMCGKRAWDMTLQSHLPQPCAQQQPAAWRLPAATTAVAMAAAAAVHAQPQAVHEAVPLEDMVGALRCADSTAVEDEGDSEDAWVWAAVAGPAVSCDTAPATGPAIGQHNNQLLQHGGSQDALMREAKRPCLAPPTWQAHARVELQGWQQQQQFGTAATERFQPFAHAVPSQVDCAALPVSTQPFTAERHAAPAATEAAYQDEGMGESSCPSPKEQLQRSMCRSSACYTPHW